jgi:cytochrome c peroxidase
MDQPEPDVGRQSITHDPDDRGKFTTPSLRNVALTWPYLHDGSAAPLADVIEF